MQFAARDAPEDYKKLYKREEKKSGYNDDVLFPPYASRGKREGILEELETGLIGFIPIPSLGDVHSHIVIPFVLHIFLRSLPIVWALILFRILFELTVYWLPDAWDLSFLQRVKRIVWFRNYDHPENVRVKRELEKEAVAAGYKSKKDIKEFVTRMHQKKLVRRAEDNVDKLITLLLTNSAIEFSSSLFSYFAVRVFHILPFRTELDGALVGQLLIAVLFLAFQGALISWISNLVVIVLLWAAFAPWNGVYSGGEPFSSFAPYLFLSVVLLYYMAAFFRVPWQGCRDRATFWSRDPRRIWNAYFGISFAFLVSGIVFLIKDA